MNTLHYTLFNSLPPSQLYLMILFPFFPEVKILISLSFLRFIKNCVFFLKTVRFFLTLLVTEQPSSLVTLKVWPHTLIGTESRI